MSENDASLIFKGTGGAQIPLLSERTAILNNIGQTLSKKHNGRVENLIEGASSVIEVAKSTISSFSFLNDERFYKAAQNFAYDYSIFNNHQTEDLGELTIFADYKLPQMLHGFGILEYSESLLLKIKEMRELRKGSQEEIEIRSATIWAGELLAEKTGLLPVFVDSCIWHVSQKSTNNFDPHHRVISAYY